MKRHSLNLILLALLSTAASASPLQFANLEDGWTPHDVRPGTFEAAFSGNAEAIINFQETSEDTLATVFVHQLPVPKVKLGDDVAAWHKVMFPKPGTIKFSVVSERTYQVNGQWRYIIEYQADTGTMLNSIAMLTIADGHLHTFLFEQHRATFIKVVASVRQLFKNITISGSEDVKQKAVLKSAKADNQ